MRNLVNFRFILKTFYLLLVKSNMYLDKNSVKFQQSENYEDTLWKNVKITLIKNNSWNFSKCVHVFTNFLSKSVTVNFSQFEKFFSLWQITYPSQFFGKIRYLFELISFFVKSANWSWVWLVVTTFAWEKIWFQVNSFKDSHTLFGTKITTLYISLLKETFCSNF